MTDRLSYGPMPVPDLVRERLGGEKPVARVPLGGDDELWLTPTRALVYRAEGLLSGETVDVTELSAQRVVVTEGRRKDTIRLDRGYDGDDQLAVPSKHLDAALRPVVEGVLASAGVVEDGESVEQVFRLGELSLVVAGGRVVKHVGGALWAEDDYEEYPFDDVTNLDLEQGSVSSELVIEVAGRPQRIKTPSEDAHEIRQAIESALLAYHEVDSLAAYRQQVAPEEAEDAPGDAGAGGEPVSSEPVSDDLGSLLEFGDLDDAREELERDRRAEAEAEAAADAAAGDGGTGDLAAEVAALRQAVDRQGERIEQQRATIERLIEELRRVS